MGVHQKIDRVARRHVARRVPPGMHFPSAHDILHFEGLNGPDGIKRKSPAQDEPWHYIDPHDKTDRALTGMITDHIHNLAVALGANNSERAAFEAAWLAHAIVDGLTPAHHYPLEEKLEQLRGEGLETRRTTKDKLLLPGRTRRIQLRNNWEFWGAKGVMTTHLGFELGVATTVAAQRFEASEPSDSDYKRIDDEGFESVFYDTLGEIAALDMYKEYGRSGWSRRLARQTRAVLAPLIIKAVTLAWYRAVVLAEGKR